MKITGNSGRQIPHGPRYSTKFKESKPLDFGLLLQTHKI